ASAPARDSVYLGTCLPVESTPVNPSLRRKFVNCRSETFTKCTQSVRASFRRMVLKSGEKAKKTRGAS
ncbi:hypothetical protein FRC00_012799, partial [Tulasnella sp. 408]